MSLILLILGWISFRRIGGLYPVQSLSGDLRHDAHGACDRLWLAAWPMAKHSKMKKKMPIVGVFLIYIYYIYIYIIYIIYIYTYRERERTLHSLFVFFSV